MPMLQQPDPGNTRTAGVGTLAMTVWPTFAGVGVGHPGDRLAAVSEPLAAGYQRGQIAWEPANGTVIGRALVYVPAGEYTHSLFFRGPDGPSLCGSRRLPHPIRFDRPGVIELYPITNEDLELLAPAGG